MKRRDFLKIAAAAPTVVAASRVLRPTPDAWAEQRAFDPRPEKWRTFEITTRAEILAARDVTRVWLPLPAVDGDYQTIVSATQPSGNAAHADTIHDRSGAAMLFATFAHGEAAPVVEVTTRVRTRNRALDWSSTRSSHQGPKDLARWTTASRLMPTDGIVEETARRIAGGMHGDVEKVRAIYDWIVTNTYRETTVRGCGTGDIKAMLESKNLGGKCADINALFVALVRSVGVPARDVYGIRVAPSAFGYRSLGAGSATITKAQHCRAEAYLGDYGWVAMDPADVTKVAREETADWLGIDDPVVQAVRPKLFGGWEGNWVAYNSAHDVVLPQAADHAPLAFLMYPQCETAGKRRDCLDADNFKYTITAREIDA